MDSDSSRTALTLHFIGPEKQKNGKEKMAVTTIYESVME
jgi:hypothetical protein